MFIAHGEKLRKYAPWIFAGVLLLLIPSFVALFTPGGRGRGGRDSRLPSMRGEPVDPVVFENARNAVETQYRLSTGGRLPAGPEVQELLDRRALTRLLIQEKARQMGIAVTDDDVVQQIQRMPLFQGEGGQFNPSLYHQFTIQLNNLRIGESQFERLVRDDLVEQRLRELVTSTAAVTPLEIDLELEPLYETIAIDYVLLQTTDQAALPPVSDEEIMKFYEQNTESFRRPRQVKVRFARFDLAAARQQVQVTDADIAEYYERSKADYAEGDEGPKPLEAVSTEIREKLLEMRSDRRAADRATELSVKLVPEPGEPRPDFSKLAAEYGATVGETGYFGSGDPIDGVEADSQFSQTALVLTPEVPFSDPVRGKESYYVLEYLASKPSEIPPLVEVKDQVLERVKSRQQAEAMVKRGRELVTKLREQTAAGKDFAQSAGELGLTVVSAEPFSLAKPPSGLPRGASIAEVALGMAPNTVSELIPVPDGALIFLLKSRQPPAAPEETETQAQLRAELLQRNREALWGSWLQAQWSEEQVVLPARPMPAPAEALPDEQSAPAPEAETSG